MRLNKVAICGVGLIGGSFALALKAAGVVGEVVGLGRTREALDNALRLGVIDRIARDWPDALAGTDLVLLGMPVGQMAAAMAALAPHLGAQTVITDVGSTKSDVVTAARTALGVRVGQFVPGHPIAGAEQSGVNAAHAQLYRNKRVVLTPLPENTSEHLLRIRSVWEAAGAQVSILTPEDHDSVFAAVSHLPHLLAFALVHELSTRNNSDQLFGFAAGGFRDFTRIASSHPEMWRDICLANRVALLEELDAFMAELERTETLLAAGDGEGLEAMFTAARERRGAWLDSQQA